MSQGSRSHMHTYRTLRRVAPTVAPPSLAGLLAGLGSMAVPGAFAHRLETEIRSLFPDSAHISGAATGRAALMRAVQLSMRVTGRPKVVVPAYTSFSVAAAAAAAGAVVDLCDLDPVTFDLDRKALHRLVGSDTAAVVLGNLFGYPSATHDLSWIRAGGTLVIDDAAQALGAREHGRRVGSRGAFGVLSFGRGKCVSTGQGGALLVNAPELASEVAPRSCRPARGFANWVVAAGSKFCTSPLAFGLLSRLPGTRVGESRFDPGVVDAPAPAAVDGLATDLKAAVERGLAERTRVALQWFEGMRPYGLTTVSVAEACVPSYLRFPLMARDEEERAEVVRALGRRCFPFATSYPCSLSELPAFVERWVDHRAAPSAVEIARRLIALPCHRGVRTAHRRAALKGIAAMMCREPARPAAALHRLEVEAPECKT